jgi:hypothetical protein
VGGLDKLIEVIKTQDVATGVGWSSGARVLIALQSGRDVVWSLGLFGYDVADDVNKWYPVMSGVRETLFRSRKTELAP